jgi:pimeloyl-ACP methyl ester carboxylesterase
MPVLVGLAPVVASIAFAACSSTPLQPEAKHFVPTSGTVNMLFQRAGFYDAPFPSDDLVRSDGTIAIDAFPNPAGIPLVTMTKAMAGTSHGFALEGAVFFTLTAPVSTAKLPTMADTVSASASVFLMNVGSTSPDYLKRIPLKVQFEIDGGPYGAPNLLSLLPLQGTPMRPRTAYAAVVTTALGVAASAEMTAIATGTPPAGLSPAAFREYESALAALDKAGVAASSIAGLAVFTTDDPTAQQPLVYAAATANVPTPDRPFQRTDVYDSYCVYESTLPMPDYQAGQYPYNFECATADPLCKQAGGGWVFDAAGQPVLQRHEEAGMVVTIPRAPMPAAGWPIAHFIRTGGGGSRPLVDRGPEASNGAPPIIPGTGPALWFAMAGFAGAEVDGPHENLRNLTNENEDFLMFNVFNPPALRDNIRESGVEYGLLAEVLKTLTLDVSDCPGTTGPAHFDASHFALMGHSMGATIAPLAAAYEPLYRAVVASGSGASWIENVIWKQQPLDIRGVIGVLLGYSQQKRALNDDDPILTLFQWAEEPADSDMYSRELIAEPSKDMPPRHWLMEQGIVDHYILPPIANAMSLSLGLDLLGKPLDGSSAELKDAGDPTIESVIGFSTGKQLLTYPVSGNRTSQGQTLTTIVTQHPADGIEDGHEMVFQTDAPKREYRCFLQTWAAGQTPVIPAPGDLTGPCQ